MDNELYKMIFKRKSFHLFRNTGNECISSDELADIEEKFNALVPLDDSIKVRIKIVKDSSSYKRGQEYFILFYSEKKDNYLQNIGYIGEQLDLYLVSKNIGTLWFGIGKPKESTFEGLDYVIMMAISKIDSEDKFRKDMFKSKRKEVSEIWHGDAYTEIANIARFAPSACNSQPWRIEAEPGTLKIYRYRKPVKIGIMPVNKAPYFNQIDIGIFLCFIELCMEHNGIGFKRTLFIEEDSNNDINLSASYSLV